MNFSKDITSKKYHRLTAIRFIEKKQQNDYWLFRCDCGNEVVYRKNNVTASITKTKSCGCLNIENAVKTGINNKTHGMSKTRFYYVWKTMKNRCENPNVTKYKNYGARGIKVLWKSFESFMKDMYSDYLNHIKQYGSDTSIDRVDNDGDYCRENCRWATAYEQANNKRI